MATSMVDPMAEANLLAEAAKYVPAFKGRKTSSKKKQAREGQRQKEQKERQPKAKKHA